MANNGCLSGSEKKKEKTSNSLSFFSLLFSIEGREGGGVSLIPPELLIIWNLACFFLSSYLSPIASNFILFLFFYGHSFLSFFLGSSFLASFFLCVEL